MAEDRVSFGTIRPIHAIPEFLEQVLRCHYNVSVIVLAVSNRVELSEFRRFQSHLSDIPLILILPDNKPETVSDGLKLYPRFIGYAGDNFLDVLLVLEKMMESRSGEKYQFGRLGTNENKPV